MNIFTKPFLLPFFIGILTCGNVSFANDALKLAPQGWRDGFSDLTTEKEHSIKLEDLLIAGECKEAVAYLDEFRNEDIGQYWWSRMYELGVCVDKDPKKAFEIIKGLTDEGWFLAIRTGLFYENGIGTEKKF